MSEEKKKIRKRKIETYGKAQIREENYFEKKLETAKETLNSAERKVEHLDLQIHKLKQRFDHDKNVYNDQTKHMQDIIVEMKKRIPILEKKIEQGYTTIDLKTGKAFKSFKERHIEHLKEKVEWAEANRKQLEAKHKLKLELKNKKRLKPEEKEIVVAEEIRESLQGEDEINQVYEKQIEDLQKKKALYQQQLDELTQKEEEAEVKETEPHKVECPECHNYFTKGGAFTAHLRSHFPNSNSKE